MVQFGALELGFHSNFQTSFLYMQNGAITQGRSLPFPTAVRWAIKVIMTLCSQLPGFNHNWDSLKEVSIFVHLLFKKESFWKITWYKQHCYLLHPKDSCFNYKNHLYKMLFFSLTHTNCPKNQFIRDSIVSVKEQLQFCFNLCDMMNHFRQWFLIFVLFLFYVFQENLFSSSPIYLTSQAMFGSW